MNTFAAKIFVKIHYRFGKIIKKITPSLVRDKAKAIVKNQLKENNVNTVPSMRKEELTKLKDGINLIGYFKAEMGLGQGCRLIAKALCVGRIDWCGISFDKLDHSVSQRDMVWSPKLVKKPIYKINLFHINPDTLYISKVYLHKDVFRIPYNIGIVLWELTEIPEEWIKDLSFFQELWTPSGFIADALAKCVEVPVLKVPYGISVENYDRYSRQYFGLPEDVFFYLVMYDANSTSKRKNPMGVINAYVRAFKPEDEQVGIIIKINNSVNQDTNELSEMKAMLSRYKNVIFIEKTLSRDEVNSLINCADSFVSLHRAEGFGLIIAEAMYLGKPVIATNWSANTEFMNNENSCLVDYSIVDIDKDYGSYKKGMTWAEPDYDDAANYMERLVRDKDYYNMLSKNAYEYIREDYSYEKCAGIINNRLKQLL